MTTAISNAPRSPASRPGREASSSAPSTTTRTILTRRKSTTPTRGWISRYAWSREDYHDAVLRRLKQVEAALRQALPADRQPALTTRSYVDTGPIVERVFAKYAGVGWIGKNTCIINQKKGSWLFLGVILTSLELAPDLPAPDRCGTCTRCIEACPTDAILAPYQLDSNRCISYLTIEKRGSIPEDLRAGMGHHVFGCDICQDVCPWNRKAPASTAPEFEPRPGLVNPALAWLAEMSAEEFREAFRGSPIRRTKRSGLRRNAAIAMGNSGNQEFLPLLDQLAADEDESVGESARWAKARLLKSDRIMPQTLLYIRCIFALASFQSPEFVLTFRNWSPRFPATNLCLKGS